MEAEVTLQAARGQNMSIEFVGVVVIVAVALVVAFVAALIWRAVKR